MARALFIKRADVVAFTAANGNIDYDKFQPALFVAQDRDIHTILGTALYNRIEAGIIAGDLTADEMELINDYIKYCLLWYALSEALPWIAFNVQNGGVFQHQPESATAASRNDVNYLSGKAKDTAQWYEKRMKDYLCTNSTRYPLYTTLADPGIPRSTSDGNFQGWQI
jgi:hypothetical protein